MNKCRIISMLIIIALVSSLFSGCSSNISDDKEIEKKETSKNKDDDKNKGTNKSKNANGAKANDKKEEKVKLKKQTIDENFLFQVLDRAKKIKSYKSHTKTYIKSDSEQRAHEIDIDFKGKSSKPNDVEKCIIKSKDIKTNDSKLSKSDQEDAKISDNESIIKEYDDNGNLSNTLLITRSHQEYTRVSANEVVLKEFNKNGKLIKTSSSKGLNFTPNYYGQLGSLLTIVSKLEAREKDGKIAFIFREGGKLKKEELFKALKYDYSLHLSGDDTKNIKTEFLVVIDIESKNIETVFLSMKYKGNMEFLATTNYFDIK